MKKLLCLLLILVSNKVFAMSAGVDSPHTANTVLAGPTSGGNAQPTFRTLVAADIGANIVTSTAIAASSVNLTTKVTGVLPILNGGSNGSTKQAAFDNLSPGVAKGDLIVFNGTNNVVLTAGTNNFVLTADSTTGTGIKWAAAGAGAAFSGLTGGTNSSGAAMLVGNTSSLAPTGTGTVTANQFVGTGSTTNAVDLATAEVSGILPLANGGTGSNLNGTGAAHSVLMQTSVGANVSVALLAEADLPATTAFTDTANTFTTVQTFSNYIATQSSTPGIINSDQVAFDPGASSYSRISSSASFNIQGMVGGVNGRKLTAVNIGGSNIVFQNQNVSASAANRIICPSGTDITVAPNYGIILVYDSTDSRWRIVTVFQVPGGGTGFNLITSGSNTGQTLTVGNGSVFAASGTGTITATAISFTLPANQGGTGLTSGNSGGVPYFSTATTIASSSQLAQYAIVTGGGPGAAPVSLGSIGTTTTVLHGNPAGLPSFSAVSLTADVSGILPVTGGGSGIATVGTNVNGVVCGGTTATGIWQTVTNGTTGQFLTAITGGIPTWTTVAPGSVTGQAPIIVTGSSVALGTAIGPNTSDTNSSVGIGSAASGKKVCIFQTVAGNTQPAVEIQNSTGSSGMQWQIDNSLTSNVDIKETLRTAKQAAIQLQSLTETLTLNTGSTTTNTAANLIPANSFVIGVLYRVTTAITTASSFSVGDSVSTTRFGSGNAITLGTTGSSFAQTNPCSPFTNGTATTVTITTNVNPGAGVVEITTFYYTLTAPQQ